MRDLSLLNVLFIYLCCCCCCYGAMAYQIPRVTLELLNDGFRVSIPDEPGVTMVVFNIEIDQQCPVLLDLITEQRGNFWMSEQLTYKLERNSKVKINVMAMHTTGLFSRTDLVVISENFAAIYQTIKEGDKPIDTCAAQPESVDNTAKASETKVFIENRLSDKLYKSNDQIFNEEFINGKLPNWNKDEYISSNAIGDRSEDFVLYSKNNTNLSVSQQTLLITPSISKYNSQSTFTIDRCTPPACYENNNYVCEYMKERTRTYMYPPPVSSARINTKDKFSFQYGRIEIDAKLPEGDWLFPYIMLVPDKENCTKRKQLRISHATSNDLLNLRIRGGPVVINGRPNPSKPSKHMFDRMSYMTIRGDVEKPNGYHNYTLVWTSQEIRLYFDNVKFGCISNNGEYDEPFHIVLGVGAGGHLEFPDTKSKPWRNGYNDAFTLFHYSFTDCCATGTPKVSCKEGKRSRICSKQWGPQATMAIRSVRVYAV
ncbi:unnamed protein product [Ceratitis capitata]|uniref:(Mediterranean fruit fly) hypothetical protein n=1 Tax=Ceratitis capitata TaxID=7213 RepID=A0A811V6D3_CERCA|nr:unnamed protein product [Ceratitis capitata]